MLFKRFLIWITGNPLVWWSGTICRHYWEQSSEIFKFGPVVQEEMSFKEKVHRWTEAGRRAITIVYLEPLAQDSGELKKLDIQYKGLAYRFYLSQVTSLELKKCDHGHQNLITQQRF